MLPFGSHADLRDVIKMHQFFFFSTYFYSDHYLLTLTKRGFWFLKKYKAEVMKSTNSSNLLQPTAQTTPIITVQTNAREQGVCAIPEIETYLSSSLKKALLLQKQKLPKHFNYLVS